MDAREIYDWIFGETPRAVWSHGVALSRTATVNRQASDDEDELVFTVSPRIGILTRTVRIFTEDEDFLCDCSHKDDVCDHLVAVVLVLKEADERGEEVADSSDAIGHIGYRLIRTRGGLRLDRVVVSGQGERPMSGTAAAAALHNSDGVRVTNKPLDLEIESVTGYRHLSWLPAGIMVPLLKKLRSAPDVLLDGAEIAFENRAVGLIAKVSNRSDGFDVKVEHDPCIVEAFNSGVALCVTGDGKHVLRPLAEPGLTARELSDYREGKLFRGGAVSRLVSEIIPGLQKRLPVVIAAKGLPKTVADPPRLVVDTRREAHELVVLTTLVYGKPEYARVDGEQITLLGAAHRVPLRDLDEEERLKRRATSALGLDVGHRVRFNGEDAVGLAGRLEHWKGEVRGNGLEGFFIAPPLEAQVVPNLAGFDVLFETADPAYPTGGRGTASAALVLGAWRSGASLVPLSDGGWAPLPADWLQRFGPTIADLLAAKTAAGDLPRAALPDLGRLCEALETPAPPELAGLREVLAAEPDKREPTLPADLTATLRDYQRDGVAWLQLLQRAQLGALLADDMGLGKTLQALCTVRGRTLVVAPTSVLHNWKQEIERFRPNLSVSVYYGAKRALDAQVDVTLTTYALLRLDQDALSAVRWDTVVLDEAQAIKNPDSQVARAAFRLQAEFRVTLTGTPVENRLEELWSQIHFSNPGLLGGRSDFVERYAKPIGLGEPGAAARLRDRIRPFLLRRLKRDVAKELPPRTDMVLRCELDADERRVYDAIRASTQKDVAQRLAQGGSVLEALEALLRLRQAACHRGLVPGQEADDSAKVRVLMATLETAHAEGHKSLVFSQWTGFLDRVEPHLDAAGLDFVRLDGSTRDRAGVVNRFQSETGPPVMLLSLKAGGTGLNLTQADHVFLLDPWWNPAVEDQAADRAHRIGQDRPVLVHRLVAADTVEERILALQEHKRSLADAALGGADRAASLTRNDLLDLLR